MHKSLGSRRTKLAPAKVLHHFVVTAIDLLAILTLVRKQSRLLLIAHRGDVHVIRRMKAHRLGAEIDFIVIEPEAASAGEPCPKRQSARSLVILVAIDGPLREYYIRTLGGEDAPQRLRGFRINHRGAI